jgi:TonB family protein
MRGLLLVALAFLTPAAATATVAPPPEKPQPQLLTFAPTPTAFTCGKGQARLIEGAPLLPRPQQGFVRVGGAGPSPVLERYAFGVDADGRVIDLKREGAWTPESQAPVIASWRFAPGAPASDCKLQPTATVTPLDQTTPAQRLQAMISEGRAAPIYLRKALDDLGDCARTPRRRPQTISYPDLRAFGDRSVDPAWAGVTYDIDGDGAVRNVRIVTQHGEPAFADLAAASVAESRFQTGSPRTGCHAVFKARPKASPASKRPDAASFERPSDACALKKVPLPEVMPYPPAYAARRVGGWAIVRFDVAPWGQIGPVEVLASQPAQAFGVAAINLMQNIRLPAPPTGYRGCVMPIIYATPAVVDDED